MRISDWSSDVCSSDLTSLSSLCGVPAGSVTADAFAGPPLNPAASAARTPTDMPSARQPTSVKTPLQDPADRSACVDCSGSNIPPAASKRSRARDWEKRCTTGFQPPDTQSRSQGMLRAEPCTPLPSRSEEPPSDLQSLM